MGDVRRSDSKEDITNLLDDIRGIVHENKQTLASLKAIKQKNDEVAKSKTRIDIPSIVSGKKKNEIDIPHKRAKAGEHESEINKRSKYTNHEEPDYSIPTVSVGRMLNVESAPPELSRFPTRDDSNEKRRSRRDKSAERKRKVDAIRQKTYDRPEDSSPTREPVTRGRELTRPTIEPIHQRRQPSSEAPQPRNRSPQYRNRSPRSKDRSPQPRNTRSPQSRNRSPQSRNRSPQSRNRSPQSRNRSPQSRNRSPQSRNRSPQSRNRSPQSRNRSPQSRNRNQAPPRVEVGSVPTERTEAPRARTPSELKNPQSRNRIPSDNSDWGSHNHLYRIRKDSEGSVEIFPELVEEDCVITEYKDPVLSRNGSWGELPKDESLAKSSQPRPGVSPGRSLPRIAGVPNKWFAKAGISPLKRRIILEKCPDCDNGDSPPEIEIRICKRDKCGKYRSENDINIVSGPALSLYTTPDPPNRSSSLNRIPQKSDGPLSPSTFRPQSPSSIEVERMARRLQLLKQEVDNVIKECENENIPISISIQDSERPKSPYHPDKTPYYRARYHSAPQSPTGQNNKTTSTTDILKHQVYHPAEEEKQVNEEVLLLSTQSLELPEDDGRSLTGQIEMEVVALEECDAPVPPAPFKTCYDNEDFEPECDLGSSTHVSNIPITHMPKREEELLTPPPLPPRNGTGDITLRGDNLFDPFHIGTTYVVLSKQNHGRFKFQNPVDPNKSVPPSPKPAKAEVDGPLIKAIHVAPVSSAPPVSTPRRNLYQPKSLNGSLISLTSLPNIKSDLDLTPTKLGSSPPRQRAATAPLKGPPLPARAAGKAMSPEQRRKFNRPQKEPVYREVPVDCGASAPPVNTRKPSLQELQLEQKNPASREFHMQNITDQGDPRRGSSRSSDSNGLPGSQPNSLPRSHSNSLPRSQSPFERSFSPSSQNTLRRRMPYVKLLGEEWKELAQRLGYENSQIASFARDYPDPGQAMLDHWSRQPDSILDDLLYHLKFMGLWKTADTIDKTFDKTNV